MNNVKPIRKRLGLSQAEFADAIGVTQGNVSHIERGQEVTPAVARRIIAAAAERGHEVTFDDIYGAGRPAEDRGKVDQGEGPPKPSRSRPLPESGQWANTASRTDEPNSIDATAKTAECASTAVATRAGGSECVGVA